MQRVPEGLLTMCRDFRRMTSWYGINIYLVAYACSICAPQVIHKTEARPAIIWNNRVIVQPNDATNNQGLMATMSQLSQIHCQKEKK